MNNQVHIGLQKHSLESLIKMLFELVNIDNLTNCNQLRKIIEILITKGVEFPYIKHDGATPLHCVSANGNIIVAKCLIEYGANIMAKDKSKATPLHYAVLNQEFNMIKFLIANGSDVNALDENGDTPLSIAKNNNDDDISIYEFLNETNHFDNETLMSPYKFDGFEYLMQQRRHSQIVYSIIYNPTNILTTNKVRTIKNLTSVKLIIQLMAIHKRQRFLPAYGSHPIELLKSFNFEFHTIQYFTIKDLGQLVMVNTSFRDHYNQTIKENSLGNYILHINKEPNVISILQTSNINATALSSVLNSAFILTDYDTTRSYE